MPDFFAPSYWYGAGPDFSGLANAQASQAQTNNYLANQQAQLAQWNSYNPYANSGGSFGVQPAHYAALGAAYGRETGGFAPENVGGVDAAKWGTMTPQEKLDHNRAVGRDQISENIGNVDAGKWSTMTPQEKFDHNQAVKRDRGLTPSQFKWDAYQGPMSSNANRDDLAGMMYGANSGQLGYLNRFGGYQTSGGSGSQNFQDLWHQRAIPPPHVPSPYGPGGYPPMEPAVPGQQSQNWYGQPSASS